MRTRAGRIDRAVAADHPVDLDGVGRVTIDSTDHDIQTGEIIIMPANIPHSVSADQKFKMQLTMIRQ